MKITPKDGNITIEMTEQEAAGLAMILGSMRQKDVSEATKAFMRDNQDQDTKNMIEAFGGNIDPDFTFPLFCAIADYFVDKE